MIPTVNLANQRVQFKTSSPDIVEIPDINFFAHMLPHKPYRRNPQLKVPTTCTEILTLEQIAENAAIVRQMEAECELWQTNNVPDSMPTYNGEQVKQVTQLDVSLPTQQSGGGVMIDQPQKLKGLQSKNAQIQSPSK